MKPNLFWESLNPDERRELADSLEMSVDHLGKVLRGDRPVSLPRAVSIADKCGNIIDPVALLSAENRKALKQLGKV